MLRVTQELVGTDDRTDRHLVYTEEGEGCRLCRQRCVAEGKATDRDCICTCSYSQSIDLAADDVCNAEATGPRAREIRRLWRFVS